jgi:hypothetical protein
LLWYLSYVYYQWVGHPSTWRKPSLVDLSAFFRMYLAEVYEVLFCHSYNQPIFYACLYHPYFIKRGQPTVFWIGNWPLFTNQGWYACATMDSLLLKVLFVP